MGSRLRQRNVTDELSDDLRADLFIHEYLKIPRPHRRPCSRIDGHDPLLEGPIEVLGHRFRPAHIHRRTGQQEQFERLIRIRAQLQPLGRPDINTVAGFYRKLTPGHSHLSSAFHTKRMTSLPPILSTGELPPRTSRKSCVW